MLHYIFFRFYIINIIYVFLISLKRREETWESNECISLSSHFCFALMHSWYSSNFSNCFSSYLFNLFILSN